MGFEWIPGEGPCQRRLSAMRDATPLPDQPMGEAWFIGAERRMFDELCGDLDVVSVFDLQNALDELAGGLRSFGPEADNWIGWADYLVPRLVPRCGERYASWLLEEVCTATLQRDFADAGDFPRRFSKDEVLNTLGRSLMDASRWESGKIIPEKILCCGDGIPSEVMRVNWVSGDLAASMMLCLRLIPEKDIEGWVHSFLEIQCPFWRSHILTWYVGAQTFLAGKTVFPSQLDGWTPRIEWSGSHLLSGMYAEERVAERFVPCTKLKLFKAAFDAQLASADLNAWLVECLAADAMDTGIARRLECFRF